MGRFLFWIVVLAGIAGGAYVYFVKPDPVVVRASVNHAVAELTTQVQNLIAGGEEVAGDEGMSASETAREEEATPEATETPAAPSIPAPPPASQGAVDRQTLDQYRAWISEARAAHPYPDSEEHMYAVMMCESHGRASVVNSAGPYSGLFQYSSALWNGDWNTYRDQGILDPHAQIFATALAWSDGMQRQWGCYNRTH